MLHHSPANPAVFPWEALRRAHEDTCLLGKKKIKNKNLSFLLLSFLDANQDEQAWPGGMTSPF